MIKVYEIPKIHMKFIIRIKLILKNKPNLNVMEKWLQELEVLLQHYHLLREQWEDEFLLLQLLLLELQEDMPGLMEDRN
jgi:hypothetical protein